MMGLSVVNIESKSRSESPCGCSVGDWIVIKSTTLTTRILMSGKCWRSKSTAASVSKVGTSPGTGHDNIRLAPLVRTRPFPSPDSSRAMLDGSFHVKPLQRGLLAGDNHIHVVATPQAVIGNRKQRVRVGRQVHADDVSLLVDHVIDKAGVLVRETVMVLPPHVRCEQVIQRGDWTPPWDLPRHL